MFTSLLFINKDEETADPNSASADRKDKGTSNDVPSDAVSSSAEHQKKDPVQANTDTNNSHDCPKPLGHPSRMWQFITETKHSNAVVAIFTLLLFITTTIYTVFAALQWSTLVKDQRPWIAAPDVGVGVDPHKPYAIEMKFRNIGKTPAMHVYIDAVSEATPPEMTVEELRRAAIKICAGHKLESPYSIFPGDLDFRIRHFPVPSGLDPNDVRPNGHQPLFRVFGCVAYTFTDSEAPHHTGFDIVLKDTGRGLEKVYVLAIDAT